MNVIIQAWRSFKPTPQMKLALTKPFGKANPTKKSKSKNKQGFMAKRSIYMDSIIGSKKKAYEDSDDDSFESRKFLNSTSSSLALMLWTKWCCSKWCHRLLRLMHASMHSNRPPFWTTGRTWRKSPPRRMHLPPKGMLFCIKSRKSRSIKDRMSDDNIDASSTINSSASIMKRSAKV